MFLPPVNDPQQITPFVKLNTGNRFVSAATKAAGLFVNTVAEVLPGVSASKPPPLRLVRSVAFVVIAVEGSPGGAGMAVNPVLVLTVKSTGLFVTGFERFKALVSDATT